MFFGIAILIVCVIGTIAIHLAKAIAQENNNLNNVFKREIDDKRYIDWLESQFDNGA